jgi:hypothetical protein
MEIDTIIQRVRTSLLEVGYVVPTIMMQMSETTALLLLREIERQHTVPMQCGMLSHLGWENGRKYAGQEVLAVCFYANVWRSEVMSNYWLRPGEDPQRQEYASISFWHSQYVPNVLKEQAYSLRIIRNSYDDVIKVAYPTTPDLSLSVQLAAYMEGIRHSSMTREESVADMRQKTLDKLREYPPDKQRYLIQHIIQEVPSIEEHLRKAGFQF